MSDALAGSDAPGHTRPGAFGPALGMILLACAAALLAFACAREVPPASWGAMIFAPRPFDMAQLMVREALLPRFSVSLLAGAALGLSGAMFQQVLRNPLAEPGTLGVFSGAKLAVMTAMLFAPQFLAFGPEAVALAGGGASFLAVAAIGLRQRFAPLVVILAGMVIGLFCEGVSQALLLFYHEALTDLLVWQAGSLAQNNWGPTRMLAQVLAAGALVAGLLARPLMAFDLSDAGARGLGVAVAPFRAAALCAAVGLAVGVAANVGVIAFVGLAGPALARAAGARTSTERLWMAPLFGAGILALTDQVVAATFGSQLPTGAVTAVLGAPLLLWLLRRVRPGAMGPGILAAVGRRLDDRAAMVVIAGLVLGLLATCTISLVAGRVPGGWTLAFGPDLQAVMPWRAPRVAVAAAAGALFALSGQILQRTTGNPLASPELFGIAAGAGLGLVAALLLLPQVEGAALFASTGLGAGATLAAMMALGRRSGFAPAHILLAGIALTSLLSALGAVLLFSGDPRALVLVAWLSGSTYGVTTGEAAAACAAALAGLAVLPLMHRWLAILPLGPDLSRSLGVRLRPSRLLLLGLAAMATAVGTLVTGPLSFAGLMAPHMARLLGFRGVLTQSYAAALIGAALMVCADFLGRTLAFPWQMPAGLVASLLGGGYFLLLLARRVS